MTGWIQRLLKVQVKCHAPSLYGRRLCLMLLLPYLLTQALLLKAHEVEVKKEKEENKILKQLAYDKADRATEVRLRLTRNDASSKV